MDRKKLTETLNENHGLFIDFINSLAEDEFLSRRNGKWTAGQHLEHIYLSVKPLDRILSFPQFMIKWFFGTANRQSKSYDELVSKYQSKLQAGGRATGRFVPKEITFTEHKKLTRFLKDTVLQLTSKINHFSEQNLDTIILPHPLLGNLTLREMLYFTIYHVKHHHKIVADELQ